MLRLYDLTSGATIADHVRPAHTHWTRMKGLLGTDNLPEGHGLWIKPCNQIHMYMMRYPVDLIFVDGDLRVVKAIENQPVNSISAKYVDAESVVELPVGTVAKARVAEGATLGIEGVAEPVASGWLESVGPLAVNLMMAMLYGSFVFRHVQVANEYHQWLTALPIILQEALLVVLFLARRRSLEMSWHPKDWALALVGTGLPLLLSPTAEVSRVAPAAQLVQTFGLVLAGLGTLSLGRSFGIVAGNRGVKTRGAHSIVRHPTYVGYAIGYIGYAAVYLSVFNVITIALAIAILVARAVAEERFLARDPAYVSYRERVRWRFLPYVY